MEIVSARNFRSNQGRFLSAAKEGKSVILTSRYGNFRIVPVHDEDEIVKKDIRLACEEVVAHLNGEIELPSARSVKF